MQLQLVAHREMVRGALSRLRNRQLSMAWEKWQEWYDERRLAKVLMSGAARRLRNLPAARAFGSWLEWYKDVKNQQRERQGKGALQGYYRDFALLQEVTKAACNRICGDLTVAHTSPKISPFSVTSFYQVGLDLSLISVDQIMPYDD